MLEKEKPRIYSDEMFRFLEALAEASPNLVWGCNADGQCTYINKRWYEYTGQPEVDVLGGNDWLEYLHPDDRQPAHEAWNLAVGSGQPFNTDFRLRRSDGEYRWFNSRGVPQIDAQGKVLSWTGACTDIDDTKRAKELLEKSVQERTAQLEQANKDLQYARDRAIEASSVKSKFVANISHEIRTPMSGVLGMSELLLTCDLDEEARELSQYIYTSARSLLEVVNDLLDFSKLEAGKLSISRMRFNMDKVVNEVAQTTAISAHQKNLKLTLNVEPDLPEVYGDANRIRQVLLNLVHNAIKFTSKGSVSIDVRAVSTTKNAVTVRFTVMDTGIGIAEESRSHLFNPFEQADGSTTRKYGGTGLGLSISRSLVQLMLGEIGFDSEEGKGSTFWFNIPMEIA